MSTKRMILAGNWKMNHGPVAAKDFMKQFCELWDKENNFQTLIFPPAISWSQVKDGVESLSSSNVSWGLQNFHFEDSGAFTGEVSCKMAQEIGAKYLLVGHSERRQIFQETDKLIAQKVKAAQSNNLVSVLCLGETLEQREAGQTESVIKQQLLQGLSQADSAKEVILAYEPVWAIGTGKVATPEQAQKSHEFLRQVLQETCYSSQADEIGILYGGSVKPANSKELYNEKDIDGFLVGGASLVAETFLQIAHNIEK